jgi:hypothetical protein
MQSRAAPAACLALDEMERRTIRKGEVAHSLSNFPLITFLYCPCESVTAY